MQNTKSILEHLTTIHAVSGYEDDMTHFMYQHMTEYADDINIDKMGSVIAVKYGQDKDAPHVMFFAHMDEVGFMIKKHESNGLLRLVSLGGNPKTLPGQEIQIRTVDGTLGYGVVNIKSAHLTSSAEWEKVLDFQDLFVYPVINTQEMIEIEVGSTVSFRPNFRLLPDNMVCSKALDNRVGCCVLLEAMRQLKDKTLNATVAFVGTVQEEISCEGALAPAQAFGATIAVAIDGTVSYDTPDTSPEGEVYCGAGPVITRFLRTPGLNGWTPNPKLALHIEKTAKEAGINFQRDAVVGLMSDAKPLRLGDIPSAIIGIPMRCKHSPVEIVSLRDIEDAIKLVVELAQNIDGSLDLQRGHK